MKLNKYFDHTILKPEAGKADVKRICAEARQYDFASVCINPCYVALAKKELEGTDVNVCTVIGFPLGANTTAVKCYEAKEAVANGADEVDMVLNIGKVKEGNYEYIAEEVAAVKEASKPALLKVILETCLLTDEEVELASKACVKGHADYVKTSTGFSKGGATPHHVAIMRKAVGPDIGVKASGGVHNLAEANAVIEAGASRIGASASVAIMKELGE